MRVTRKRLYIVTILAMVFLESPLADGHVAPAVDKNNRYMKIEPMGDRIRFAYTVFWGQIPGAQTRQQLDRNRNKTLDKSETDPYQREIARSVAANLKFVIDGRVQQIQWAQVHMGLNTPDVGAGAFSVDLVGWLCLDSPRKRVEHEMRFYDRYKLPKPGETELTVREADGITINRSSIGDMQGSLLKFRWQGGASKLAKEGYTLRIKVDPNLATIGVDDLCTKRQAKLKSAATNPGKKDEKKSVPVWLAVVAVGGIVGSAFIVRKIVEAKFKKND